MLEQGVGEGTEAIQRATGLMQTKVEVSVFLL